MSVAEIEQREEIALGAVGTRFASSDHRAQVVIQHGTGADSVDPGTRYSWILLEDGAVPDSKELVVTDDLQCVAYADEAAFVPGQFATCGHGEGSCSTCPDDEVCCDLPLVGANSVAFDSFDAMCANDSYAALLSDLLR